MDKLAFGFWGVYFGTAALMLAGSALAFTRSLHRISLNAGLSATVSSFFVVAFLGGLPIDDESRLARVLAHIAMLVSGFLAYLLLSILGLLDSRKTRLQTRLALTVLVLGVMAAGWLLPPVLSLVLGLGFAGTLGAVALVVSLRSVYRGDRLAWTAVLGVFFMLVAMLGLGWIALGRGQEPWPVHAVSALAGTAYLVTMAAALWTRYSYLIELHQVMAMGPSYDPVTRMRSHTETGQMVGDIFRRRREGPAGPDAARAANADKGGGARAAVNARPAPHRSGPQVGVMVVSIGNLYALERLHGMAAVNHALFVCAGRLRRAVPAYVEMGRFSGDGFVLLLRDCNDSGQLIRLAHQVEARLSKSVVLNTSLDAARRESEQTRWQAEIGVGVLLVSDPAARASSVLAACKAMSRTAMSYPSRVAWLDQASGEAVELPVLQAA
ncbi:MAG: GGDEF domain-containing protein [Polaromonas sp.]|uniref:GGDEF domain-containing protein n=1 Tax=Polaromonas sp. TaxID=1869339 RepID=UPI00272F8ABE|nr:GGDEF domain-containing protein [Polaromonas sp.]MDP2451494.1 GGDEF domain-containing protein [Polaromonas sp.]MDP3246170.1 GGDEF domain-containing protein [Polaromonas sp.]MDP3753960.1 GGDEF domain-containing protein [Polaromonas sp.]MDP3826172.1 GGDEF domain-containing protein [Polaromonas sp.]